jgi:hypothetical protein
MFIRYLFQTLTSLLLVSLCLLESAALKAKAARIARSSTSDFGTPPQSNLVKTVLDFRESRIRRELSLSITITCIIELTGTAPSESETLSAYLRSNVSGSIPPRDTLADILTQILSLPPSRVGILAIRGGSPADSAAFALSVAAPPERAAAELAAGIASAIADTGSGGLAARIAARLAVGAPRARLRSAPDFFSSDGLPAGCAAGCAAVDAPEAGLVAGLVLPLVVAVAAVGAWLVWGAGVEQVEVWYRHATEKTDEEAWAKLQAVRAPRPPPTGASAVSTNPPQHRQPPTALLGRAQSPMATEGRHSPPLHLRSCIAYFYES